MNGRIHAMQKSGTALACDGVMALLGRVMKLIKTEMQGGEEMSEKDNLTNEQYNWVVDKTNELMGSVKAALVEMPRQFATQSMGQ